MFKKVAVIGICLLSVGIFFSCKTKPLHKRNVFRLNFYFGLFSLDPAFAKDQGTMWADNQLYNGLVQVDSALNVRPCIAKSWNISKDGLLYEFVLRNDVFFHDNDKFPDGKGRKVTAQDFVYSFGRLIDSNVASTGGWLFNEKVDKQLPFEAVNDTIFLIHLKSPFKPMMGLLTLQYCSVVPKEVVDFYGKDYRKHPCGTGPFKFVRWEENNVLILTKNKSYFEIDSLGNRLPYLDGVRINFVADRGTEYFQFIQHKIDFLSGLDVSYKDKLLTKSGELREEWKSKINFCKMPYLNTEYLGIAMTNQPNVALRNKKVRQAINYALDKRKMLMYLRNGIGVPAESGMIPAGLPCYAPEAVKGYSYNPEKAKQLLIEAGYPNGKGIEPVKVYSNPTYQDLITYIANELSNVGIPCKIENTTGSFLKEAMRKNDVEFFRASWIGDYPDGENYLALFYSKYGAPPNYTFFKNETYDKLYEQAMRETDNENVCKLYQQMEKIMLDEAPVVPLFYDEVTRFSHKNISGLTNNAMNLLILKHVKMIE